MKIKFLALSVLLIITACQPNRKTVGHEIEYVSGKVPMSPRPPFSVAVWAGDFCYLAGQLGTNPETGKIDATNITDETNAVMKNLDNALKLAGLSFSNVVKSTVYMTDVKEFDAMNAAYRQYFQDGKYPARETVQVASLLRGAHIEISMVAYKKR
jgi:2-iminobutanoate/2-iminopropanoate deaminase